MLAMAAPSLRTFLNSRSYEKHFIVRGDVRRLGSRAPSEMLEPHVTDSSKKETKAARQQARKDLEDENKAQPVLRWMGIVAPRRADLSHQKIRAITR